MNQATAGEIVAILGEVTAEHSFADEGAGEAFRSTLARLLHSVPEPNAWTVVRRGNGTILMLADSTLFTLTIDRIDRMGHPDALLTSRGVESHNTTVELRWDAYDEHSDGTGGYATHWNFAVQDSDSIAVIGFVQSAPHDELDRTEVFARAVARKAGWRLAA